MVFERLIFIDRDGIVNKKAEEHKYILHWEDFEFLPGFIPTFQKIYQLKYKLIIVTNQQCIGKGLISEPELDLIHRNMINKLNRNQIYIHKIYYCPHLSKMKCKCRKPNPGMLIQAKKELNYNIDYNHCFIIGDSISDIEVGKAFGCKTILLNHFLQDIPDKSQPDFIITEISQLLDIIKNLMI